MGVMQVFYSTLLLVMMTWPPVARGGNFNIADYGAKAGGKADSSEALKKAWAAACAAAGQSTIMVPAGKFLVGTAITFSGGKKVCKSGYITIKIAGTLVGPADYKVLSKTNIWLSFHNVIGVGISGGTIDGQGSSLWSCKAKSGNKCPIGANSLQFTNSENVAIIGLTLINSQIIHIGLDQCKNVKVQSVTIIAPDLSPNTDGIHIQKSSGVTILDTKIGSGDDCISIGPGTTNLWMERIKCGPGHGVSIGSLGWTLSEPGVQNVTLKTATFTGTTNGVRIKSWEKPTNGFVKNVLFQHATMTNVQYPIIIDQNYCPARNCKPTDASGLAISDVTYEDIRGSSATEVGVALNCSYKKPCTNIKYNNVKLTFKNKPAKAMCANAKGTASGANSPPKCFK